MRQFAETHLDYKIKMGQLLDILTSIKSKEVKSESRAVKQEGV
jgi:hypothetical protein